MVKNTDDGAPLKKWLGSIGFAAILGSIIIGVGWTIISEPKLRWLLKTLTRDAALLLLFASAAWAVGEIIRLRLQERTEGVEGALTALSLGTGAYALAVFLLGLAGLLYPSVLLALLGLGLFSGVKRFSLLITDLKACLKQEKKPTLLPSELLLVVLALCVGLLAFLGALMPETFFDALYWHDGFGALYLIRHHIEVFPYAVHSAMPSLVDLLYVPLLAFGDARTAKLGHFALGLGTCLWIFVLGNRWFGRRAALCGAVAFASLPGVGAMAGLGATDLGVCFFALAAFALLARWVFLRDGWGTLAASALLLGMAVGSKYSALSAGVVSAIAVVAGAIRREGWTRKALASVLLFGLLSLAIASPWYVRNLLVLHNPIYPVFEPPDSPGHVAYWNLKSDSERPSTWAAMFWKTPKDVLTRSSAYGGGADLVPGIFLIAAGVLWGLFHKGFPRWAALGVMLLYLLWAQTILIVRYLYPAIAFAAVLCGGMLLRAGRRRMLVSIGIVLMMVTSSVAMRKLMAFHESYYGGVLRFLASDVTSDDYLPHFVPHFAVARWIRENTPFYGTKLFFIGETRGYYFHRDYEPVSGYDMHPLVSWIKRTGTASRLKAFLIDRGFTHVVWAPFELKRLNDSYRHCPLGEKEEHLFREFLSQCKAVVKGYGLEVYMLPVNESVSE